LAVPPSPPPPLSPSAMRAARLAALEKLIPDAVGTSVGSTADAAGDGNGNEEGRSALKTSQARRFPPLLPLPVQPEAVQEEVIPSGRSPPSTASRSSPSTVKFVEVERNITVDDMDPAMQSARLAALDKLHSSGFAKRSGDACICPFQ